MDIRLNLPRCRDGHDGHGEQGRNHQEAHHTIGASHNGEGATDGAKLGDDMVKAENGTALFRRRSVGNPALACGKKGGRACADNRLDDGPEENARPEGQAERSNNGDGCEKGKGADVPYPGDLDRR